MDNAKTAAGKASWRCRFGMHDYHPTANDDGDKYLLCSRCAKESFPGSSFNTMPNG